MISLGLSLSIGNVFNRPVQVVSAGSSDGTSTTAASTFVPLNLAPTGLLIGSVGVTGSAGTLAWADQSGNANNGTAVAGSLGLTPAATDANFNGRGTVAFNGTNDAVAANGFGAALSAAHATGAPFYMCTVCRYVTLQAGTVGLWQFSNSAHANESISQRKTATTNTDLAVEINTAQSLTQKTGSAANDTVAHVYEYVWDGTNVVITRDGATSLASVALSGGDLALNNFTLGAERVGASAPVGFINAAYSDLFFKAGAAPATGDRANLRTYYKLVNGTP